IASARVFLVVAVIAILLVSFIVVVHSSQLSSQEEASAKALIRVNKEIATLKSILGEIETLKKKKIEREKKIDMIVKLQSMNIGPVRVLDELSLKLPSNKIWVQKLALKSGKLQLDGMTLDNQDVAKFMKQMEGSMFFSDVNLKKIQRKSSKGVPLLSYALTTKIYLQGKSKAKAKAKAKAKTAKPKTKGGTK
ncbi:PilN domain-containing protein, partial [bacterium]|nr:PilN domain-containing protein [bacterium]